MKKIHMALAALSVVVTSGWIGDGIKGDCLFREWFDLFHYNYNVCSGGARAGWMAFLLVLFILSAIYAFRAGREILTVRHLRKRDEVTPHQVLIVAVTALHPAPAREEGAILISDEKNAITLSGDIDKDIDAFDGWDRPSDTSPPNIQQMLRAIRPHIGKHPTKLERIFLVGSTGKSRGSFRLLETVAAIFSLYDQHLEISRHENPVDFENIESMTSLFDDLVQQAEKEGYREEDILLEVTGGQKTASIAAALCTLKRRGVEFQYVQTGGENPHAITFNMVAETPGKLGG